MTDLENKTRELPAERQEPETPAPSPAEVPQEAGQKPSPDAGKPRRQGMSILWPFIVIAIVGIVMSAFNIGFKMRKEKLVANGLTTRLRIVFLTDLDGEDFGSHQEKLLSVIRKADPHAILLGGNIFAATDSPERTEAAEDFLRGVASLGKPVLFVSGSNEAEGGRWPKLKAEAVSLGIRVLENQGETLDLEGNRLFFYGVDDPLVAGDEAWEKALAKGEAEAKASDALLKILLSHRPERYPRYKQGDWSIVLAGHTLGGIVRLPGIDGLYAPDQGWFPRYEGGSYKENRKPMLVSRGMAKAGAGFPRLWNQSEFYLLEIQAK